MGLVKEMTFPRVTDIHNYHSKKCNEQTCIGYSLEPNLHKKKVKGLFTDELFIKPSYSMTNHQYAKALDELKKLVKSLNPKFRFKKSKYGLYLTLMKGDPFSIKNQYGNSSIRVFHYGPSNRRTDIALSFKDKKGKMHGKRILIDGIHRFEYAIRVCVRHYERVYKVKKN